MGPPPGQSGFSIFNSCSCPGCIPFCPWLTSGRDKQERMELITCQPTDCKYSSALVLLFLFSSPSPSFFSSYSSAFPSPFALLFPLLLIPFSSLFFSPSLRPALIELCVGNVLRMVPSDFGVDRKANFHSLQREIAGQTSPLLGCWGLGPG